MTPDGQLLSSTFFPINASLVTTQFNPIQSQPQFHIRNRRQKHKHGLTVPILTYSMMQSPSWEANRFAASHEIPHISRNPKVHYRTHKRPPPVSILGQPNPVHIHTSHLLEIYPNIIHPSTPRSPQWSPSLRFPQQDPITPLSSPIRATCPAHLILLDFITRTILGEEYKSFSSSLCNLLHPPVTSSLLGLGPYTAINWSK